MTQMTNNPKDISIFSTYSLNRRSKYDGSLFSPLVVEVLDLEVLSGIGMVMLLGISMAHGFLGC